MPELLYSRYEHGAYPVEILPNSAFRVQTPRGSATFPNKRQLMLFLYNRKDNHVPFDRYFRLGRYEYRNPVPVESVLEMFARVAPQIWIRSNRGIDLAKRGHEVAKLIFKGYGKRIYQEGLDSQDVLQEVYKGILIRNNGKGAFDPERSSFSHYVYLVGRCVLANLQRATRKVTSHESPGIRFMRDGVIQEGDIGECPFLQSDPEIDFMLDDAQVWLDKRKRNPHARMAIQVLPFLYEGCRRKEIAEALEVSPNHVSQAIKFLKDNVPVWMN